MGPSGSVHGEAPSRGSKAPTRDIVFTRPATLQPNEEQDRPEFRYLEALDEMEPEDGPSDVVVADPNHRGGDPEHPVWAADYGNRLEESEMVEGFTDADFAEDPDAGK